MTEGQTPADTRPLPEEISERLKGLGFEPGIPVHEIDKVDFDFGHVKDALFGSTYRQPITVTFRSDKEALEETPIGVGLPMVVELVQAIYVPLEPSVGSGHFGCTNVPDWYLRGFLYKSGYDPYSEIIRMHAYLELGSDPDEMSKIEVARVQVVRHRMSVDRSEPLVWG